MCGELAKEVFQTKILGKHRVSYLLCPRCGLLQTEEPYWLDEAYTSPINMSDTGILVRNMYLQKVASTLIYSFFDTDGTFVDAAGGYGLFVRLMRDVGFDFYWSDKYTQNLFARGFEWDKNHKPRVELVTCFEAFEHFVNPMVEIKELLRISKNILFTTELLPAPTPEPNAWWYYGLGHGQHIAFYSPQTLQYIARAFNANLYSVGSLHLLTEKNLNRLSFSWITRTSKRGLFTFVRKKMNSRTMEDMVSMSKKTEGRF